jgi:hypothetical protein
MRITTLQVAALMLAGCGAGGNGTSSTGGSGGSSTGGQLSGPLTFAVNTILGYPSAQAYPLDGGVVIRQLNVTLDSAAVHIDYDVCTNESPSASAQDQVLIQIEDGDGIQVNTSYESLFLSDGGAGGSLGVSNKFAEFQVIIDGGTSYFPYGTGSVKLSQLEPTAVGTFAFVATLADGGGSASVLGSFTTEYCECFDLAGTADGGC